METKKCPQCGTTFTGRSNRLYCSDTCKLRSFHESEPATTMESKPVSVSHQFKKTVPRADANATKFELEVTRLRLESDEKRHQLEAQERERERQHEIEKLDREFDQEIQRTKASLERERLEWKSEKSGLLNQIETLASLSVQPINKPELKDDDEEKESSSSGIKTALWVAGGVLLLKLLSGNTGSAPVSAAVSKALTPFPSTKPQPPAPPANGSGTVA